MYTHQDNLYFGKCISDYKKSPRFVMAYVTYRTNKKLKAQNQ